ncbi:MAG: hypothetical protein PHU85_10195 [Phycisphaerae bacterium]|nr:hypothetical protein [Phycisphaerae bacterium]
MPNPLDKSADRPSGVTYPAALLAGYLLLQLLLLAWSAFPAATMRSDQPLESWLFLAGGGALFISWVWPTARRARATWRQAALEAVLLAAASVPGAVAAVIWSDAAAANVLAAGVYLLGWLAVGAVASASECGVRWVYSLLLVLANFGLLGLGYLRVDLLASDPAAAWRFSPMAQAARLAEFGWLTDSLDRIATAVPVGLLLLLVTCRLIRGPKAG